MQKIKKVNKSASPVCIGSGYFALDVVFNDVLGDSPNYWAGGSCGNVLTILAYWGWEVFPISRLGNDLASKYILKDIKSWGVKTKYIFNEDEVDTPIVIERIKKLKTGKLNHKFEWVCPFCGSKLPHYRPLQQKDTSLIVDTLPKSDVFYFDRISKSTLDIATHLKEKGSIIFFEPSSLKKSELFEKCISISDIVKYSDERIENIPADRNYHIPLEIQTLGEKGIRFRQSSVKSGMNKWTTLDSYKIDSFVDSTGAGDWCTAGIICKLGRLGIYELKKASKTQIKQALNYGQALAALNCNFEGARGLMYSNLSRAEIEKIIQKIVNKEGITKNFENHNNENPRLSKKVICKNCIR